MHWSITGLGSILSYARGTTNPDSYWLKIADLFFCSYLGFYVAKFRLMESIFWWCHHDLVLQNIPTPGTESMRHPCVYTEMLAKASHMTAVSCMESEKGNPPVGSHLDRNTEASLAQSSRKFVRGGWRNHWQAGSKGQEAPPTCLYCLPHERGWLPTLAPQPLGTSTISVNPQDSTAFFSAFQILVALLGRL